MQFENDFVLATTTKIIHYYAMHYQIAVQKPYPQHVVVRDAAVHVCVSQRIAHQNDVQPSAQVRVLPTIIIVRYRRDCVIIIQLVIKTKNHHSRCYALTFLCVSKYAVSFLLNTCMSFSPLNPWIVDTPSSFTCTFKKFDTTDTFSVSKFSCFRMSSTTSPIPADRTITGIRLLRNLLKTSALPSLEIQHAHE